MRWVYSIAVALVAASGAAEARAEPSVDPNAAIGLAPAAGTSDDSVGFDPEGDANDAVGFASSSEPGAPSSTRAIAPAPSPRPLVVGGSIREDVGVWTERLGDHGLAKARFTYEA